MAKGFTKYSKAPLFHCGRHRLGANHTTGQNHIQARIDRLDLGQHLQAVDPGMSMSSSTQSTRCERTTSSAFAPLVVVNTSYFCRTLPIQSKIASSSSTASTIGGSQPASAEQF